MDYKYGKIFNSLILIGMVTGIIYCFIYEGIKGLLLWLGLFLLPMVLTYPLYMLGVLGAGDVKLMAVAGGFLLNLQSCFQFLFLSFLTGALLSLIKMIYERNFKERMLYFFSYVWEILCLGSVRLYHSREMLSEPDGSGKKIAKQKIHFAGPVFIGTVLVYAGRFL